MSPIFEYRCPAHHERLLLRRYPERDYPVLCPVCGQPMGRVPSAPALKPDGAYSYGANSAAKGDAER